MDAEPQVYIVDDDEAVRDALELLLESVKLSHRSFENADDFLAKYNECNPGCLVLDIRMPGTNGLELQQKLKQRNIDIPIIFMSGHGDIPMAVETMSRGAVYFFRKPFREQELLDRIKQALEIDRCARLTAASRNNLQQRLASLTSREKQVFDQVTAGISNKVIAANLHISERTVEVHRSRVMKKLTAATLADLIRMRIEHE